MRLRFALASLVLVCAAGAVAQPSAAPTCADLHLVPAVRECTAVKVVPIGTAGLRILSEKNAEDEFTTKDLELWLGNRGIKHGLEGSAVHST